MNGLADLRVAFWCGLALTLTIKVAVALWRQRRRDPAAFRFWGALADFFLADTQAATTTILTIAVGWVTVTIWLGDIVDFLGSQVSMLPYHKSVAFLLGIVCEGVTAPVMARIVVLTGPKS